MQFRIKLILLSLCFSLLLQNKQGNIVGSIFMNINEHLCIHLHHWIIAIMCLIIIEYCFKDFEFKHIITNIIIGWGLSGFLVYSDRFNIITRCSITTPTLT